MDIRERLIPTEIPSNAYERIKNDVFLSLNSVKTNGEQFVINDTIWYDYTTRPPVKAKVVNSATFISKKFQDTLKENNWVTEMKIKEQRIDGYIEIETSGGKTIERETFKDFILHYWNENPDCQLNKVFDDFFHKYCNRSCFLLPPDLPSQYYGYFDTPVTTPRLRIGLEFETGNIASSFRAFSKLTFLYHTNEIDAAIFITARDKNSTATRIWPTSNRNGSFEELENRNYRENLIFPLWEFDFAPDEISREAPYLASNGTTYYPEPAGEEVSVNGINYIVHYNSSGREKMMRPVIEQQSIFPS